MPLLTTDNLTLEVTATGFADLMIDVRGRSMNILTTQLLDDLDRALELLRCSTDVQVVVISSAKKSGFIAGADVHELSAITTPQQAQQLSQRGQLVMQRLATLPIPTVARVHGACLGGGLELALACDYRVAIDLPGTQFGLPEVDLGLIPAWGGTQRLPRTVGIERALQIILTGRRLDARTAARQRLIDELLSEPVDAAFSAFADYAIQHGKRTRLRLPLHSLRQLVLESSAFGRKLLFKAFERILRGRVPDDMPAPWEALEAVRVGIRDGFEAGLVREQEAVAKLSQGNASRNLIGLFLGREEARKSVSVTTPPVTRIGVVGAGTMGAGIVELAALKGCEVAVQEVNEEALGAGVMRVAALFQKALEQRILSEEDYRRNLARIRPTIRWEGFDKVELVVEAASEDLDVKRRLFRELEKHTLPRAVLATNTSSLLVANLQDGMTHPERVVGLHFFNPVHRMPLVEVAHAPRTERRCIEAAVQWAAGLGKTPLVVKDSPGFVVNRVLMPYLNEAVLLLLEGLAPTTIDHVMVRFGMPLGPLELLDQIGIELAAHIAQGAALIFANRLPAHDAFNVMSSHRWLGLKSGKGFYVHKGKSRKVNREAIATLRKQCPRTAPLAGLPGPALVAQARERMVLLMCKEALLCEREGIADSAEIIDLAMVLGAGWAPHRGGPITYARQRGMDSVNEALTAFARQMGERFTPLG